VEITGIEEQNGRMVITAGAYGPDEKPIQGLTAANFRVSFNDQNLPIANLQTAATARWSASIVLLVDVSGSMVGEPITQAKLALQEFLKGLEPGDQVALIAFDANVSLAQDFTTNRTQLNQAIGRLTPKGDTALYDGVLEALKLADQAAHSRRLIVLLSDGQATLNHDRRDAALAAAATEGIGIVSVGLGNQIDRDFLAALTNASGGRFLEAPTPAVLRQTYASLAEAVRGQYTLTMQVPPAVDRSLSGKLSLQATYRGETALVTRDIGALQGVEPPPLDITLGGLTPGQKIDGAVTATVEAAAGVSMTAVDFFVDGRPVFKAARAPFTFELDPALFADGVHSLRAVARDQRGRSGETQLPFISVTPVVATDKSSSGIPLPVLLLAAVITLAGGGMYAHSHLKESRAPQVETRVRPWAVRASESAPKPVEGWPEPLITMPPPPAASTRALGRVVVMDEAAIRGGSLDAIREYSIGTAPLTLGTGSGCDITLVDGENRIAAEEARLWVHKGRLVYHKLTTLSAMATEGVTSGWQILDSNEEMVLGSYRILFQADVAAEEPLAGEEDIASEDLPPDDFWTRMPDDPPLKGAMPDQAYRAPDQTFRAS